MNLQKEQKMNMYIEKIIRYSAYLDCFMRITNEFIANGEENIKPTDVSTLSEYNTKLASRLHNIILQMKSDWEFM